MGELNLYQKIQNVSNEVNNISKNMTVGSGNYAYKAVSDLDVTLAIKKAETKHKITSIPTKQELVNSEVLKTLKKDNTESLTYVDTIKMTIKIIDLEDPTQFIEVESFGKGVDSGDKGFGKASTYARKYALLNAYKIATGEDPDANKSEKQSVAKTVSEKRVLIENYLNLKEATKINTLSHFNVTETSDLNDKQIEQVYTTFKAKKYI